MADIPNSKTSTWVAGGKRSQQFYGLRFKFKWTMSIKTRNPVASMQAEWGDELDVIFLLAMERTPVDRDWQRFKEDYEIVDLGRNRKLARETLNKLRNESSIEERLRSAAKPKIYEQVNTWIEHQQEARDAEAENAKKRCGGSLYGLMSNRILKWAEYEQGTIVAKEMAEELDDETPLHEVLQAQLDSLRQANALWRPFRSEDFEDTMRPSLEQHGKVAVIKELARFLKIRKQEMDAQKVLDDREKSIAATVTKLGKLGLTT